MTVFYNNDMTLIRNARRKGVIPTGDKKNNFYAVKVGRTPGIYRTWNECKAQVHGFSGARFKGFEKRADAEAYLRAENDTPRIKLDVEEQVSLSNLLSDNGDIAVAYVDGSYKENRGYAYGFAIVANEKVVHEGFGMGTDEDAAKMRNVAGELRAAMEAVKYAIEKGYPEIVIFHDYQGISSWPNGEWKAENGHTRAYKEYISRARAKIKIRFVKVEGHKGNIYNELADMLAKRAFEETV